MSPRARFYNHLIACLTITLAASAQPTLGASVTAHGSHATLDIGDTLTVIVVGRRISSDPGFMGANIVIPSHWQRGGQTVASPTVVGDTTMKQWRFQFVPTVAGSSRVTPSVHYGAEVALGVAVDTVYAASFWVEVTPAYVPPVWPWFFGGALLVVVTLGLIARTLRQRRAAAYENIAEPPLEEALRMLETIRVNRREDRARQYLVDIERVIHGYIGRRLDMAISGLTPTEISRKVTPNCPNPEAVDDLTKLLKRCAETKFGGGDVRFDALTGIEGQARSVLERLEAIWV